MNEWSFAMAGVGVGLALSVGLESAYAHLRQKFLDEPSIASYFSPKGGCTDAIVAEIRLARREVLVQAYSFSSKLIAQALIDAAERGVAVRILLDRSNEKESYSEIGDLKQYQIELLIDASHAIAHNKIIVIDGRTLLTGSFNFTRQAEHENAENLLVLKGHNELVERYRKNFFVHHQHCQEPGGVANGHLVRLKAG